MHPSFFPNGCEGLRGMLAMDLFPHVMPVQWRAAMIGSETQNWLQGVIWDGCLHAHLQEPAP